MIRLKSAAIGVILAGCLPAIGCVHHHHHHPEPVIVDPGPAGAEPEPMPGGPVGAGEAVDMFYNDLAPYGEWVYVDGPGWVWAPYGIDADWRPYQYGHWVYTDYGWTWASDEDYGWAVYHYGRWHLAPRHGWVWVPGVEWGPAWVAWHQSDDWIGWAPLPYHVRWRAGIGLDWGSSSLYVSIQSGHWSFVSSRYIVEPHVHRHIAPRARNATYIQVTRNVTNYTYIDNRVVNDSVQVNQVVRAIGRPVRRHHVRHADHPGPSRGGEHDGDDLEIYRPREHRGREPQRRPVPPGHADGHPGRNSGRNDVRHGDEQARPAAERPDGDGRPDGNRAPRPPARPQRHRPAVDDRDDGPSDRDRNGGEETMRERDDRGRQDRVAPERTRPGGNPEARGLKEHGRPSHPPETNDGNPEATSPRERPEPGGGAERPQAAPPSTRQPQPGEKPKASDFKQSGQGKSGSTPPGKSSGSGKPGKGPRGKGTKGGKANPAQPEEDEQDSARDEDEQDSSGKDKKSN